MFEDLLFFACVNRKYEYFIAPFLHFARLSNPGSRFEIMVEDPSRMVPAPDCEFGELGGAPDQFRFATRPETRSKYVYITDIDIMTTDPVPEFHIGFMAEYGTSFSNIQRPNQLYYMSGLHFVDAEVWYRDTEKFRAGIESGGKSAASRFSRGVPCGEKLLLDMVRASYPEFDTGRIRDYRLRPVHGIHCSPNRSLCGNVGWGTNRENLARFKAMAETLTDVDTKFKTRYLDVLMSLKPEDIRKVQVI